MKTIRIEKVTLNFGSGGDQALLEKGFALLEKVSGRKPVKTLATKRIPSWGIRKNLPIGAKVTLRGEEAFAFLDKVFKVHENLISPDAFDKQGNFSIAVPEYIDLEGIEYDAKLGIIGFEVAVTIERPGFRIKRRSLYKKKIPMRNIITKEEVLQFLKEKFNVEIKREGEEEE